MTYDYEHTVTGANFNCSKGREFVHDQNINDDALKVCPECNLPVKRLIGACNFKFKGGSPTPKFYN